MKIDGLKNHTWNYELDLICFATQPLQVNSKWNKQDKLASTDSIKKPIINPQQSTFNLINDLYLLQLINLLTLTYITENGASILFS